MPIFLRLWPHSVAPDPTQEGFLLMNHWSGVSGWPVSIVPADGLAPEGARPSASTMKTTFWVPYTIHKMQYALIEAGHQNEPCIIYCIPSGLDVSKYFSIPDFQNYALFNLLIWNIEHFAHIHLPDRCYYLPWTGVARTVTKFSCHPVLCSSPVDFHALWAT